MTEAALALAVILERQTERTERARRAAPVETQPVRIIQTAHLPERIVEPGLHGVGNLRQGSLW